MTTISDITAFYADVAPDNRGRLINDIWRFNNQQLESTHDFIHWLFPLDQVSQFNPKAPLLTHADLQEFQHSPILKNNLLHSLDVMLVFYGFQREHQQITPAADFKVRIGLWLQPESHHMRRISRILRSLSLLGLPQYTELLFKALSQLYLHRPDHIGESFQYWQRAASITQRDS